MLTSISSRTRKRVAIFISTILENESKLEAAKLSLASSCNRSPNYTDWQLLFASIDQHRLGFFRESELQRFLQSNCINTSPLELYSLMLQLHCDQQQNVTYQSFLDCLNPSGKEVLSSEGIDYTKASIEWKMHQQRQLNEKRVRGIDPEVEFLLVKVLHAMVHNFKVLESRKMTLLRSADFQLEGAFKAIDTARFGKVDLDCIGDFLESNNRGATEKSIARLIKKYEDNNDGFLDQASFAKMLLPIEVPNFSSTTDQTIIKKPTQQLNRISILEQTPRLGGEKFDSFTHQQSAYRIADDCLDTLKRTPSRKQNSIETNMFETTIKKPISKGQMGLPLSDQHSELSKSRKNPNYHEQNYLTRHSAMKGDEEEFFVRKMQELVRRDLNIEELKQELASQRDFNLLDSFQFLDVQSKGYLTQQDLCANLKHLQVSEASRDAVYLFFKQYDLDFSGRLEFSEFVKTFIPIEQGFRNILNSRVATGNGFSTQTKILLKDTFAAILTNAVEVEKIRQQLNKRRLFNTYDAFCAIDQGSHGFITLEDFRTLFIDYDIHFDLKEINFFFRRFDKSLDGEVCYGEFFQELTPKSPYQLDEMTTMTTAVQGASLASRQTSPILA